MSGPDGPTADDPTGQQDQPVDPDATRTALPRAARMPSAPRQADAPGRYARGAAHYDPQDQTESLPVGGQSPYFHDRRRAPYFGDRPRATPPDNADGAAYADQAAAAQTQDRAGYDEPYVEQEPRRGSGLLGPIAVIALSLVALAAAFAFTRGGDSKADQPQPLPTATVTPSSVPAVPSPTGTVPTTPTQTPWTQTSTSEPPSSSSTSSSSSSSSSTTAQLPGGVKTCSPTVGASDTTSCPFALNVAAAVGAQGRPDGSFEVTAYSRATRKDYQMSCTGGAVTICRGGKAAVVYIV